MFYYLHKIFRGKTNISILLSSIFFFSSKTYHFFTAAKDQCGWLRVAASRKIQDNEIQNPYLPKENRSVSRVSDPA